MQAEKAFDTKRRGRIPPFLIRHTFRYTFKHTFRHTIRHTFRPFFSII
ncbi:hypothetical protein DRJ79_13875 [Enterococcus faecalis]|nr:hypothetical protein CUN17_10625 [Enterococcus faecalis]RTK59009.1 hypothetical protein DRJ74_13715 [Enterococcus faecalis]RTK84697.1 hypothetical protein DRJ79_13875 [Enterococcus faecalis]